MLSAAGHILHTQPTLQVLQEYAPLIEVGAGTGYWASLLRARGSDIEAYDEAPTNNLANEYHGRCPPFTAVRPGDPSVCGKSPSRTLLLCYPPPKSSMAVECLRAYKGATVAHVGEWEGDTGTAEFERMLFEGFKLIREVQLPNWGNTAYALTIWSRRAAHESEAPMKALQCAGCEKRNVHLRRCCYCREVCVCSAVCSQKAASHLRGVHALRMIFLKTDPSFSNTQHFKLLRKGL